MIDVIEIAGTSKPDLIRKAKKIIDKLHEFLKNTYKAERYAKLGSSIRLHKTQVKIIIMLPEASHLWWKKIKDRVREVSGWVTPKQIANDDPNYFNNELD